MSIADKYFKEAANKIINDGISDVGMKVRPKWPDGTPAHTIKTFCYICRYDLSKEYPMLTIRKQAFKIWLKKPYGSGKKNLITFMILMLMFGMLGRTKKVASVKRTAIN